MKSDPGLTRLGAALRAARKKAGWTQEKLADRAHVDRTYVGFIERGARNVTFLSLLKIRDALGISWKEFGALLDHEFGRH
jgi:transcriptional regulator with XRE-family HTH domain